MVEVIVVCATLLIIWGSGLWFWTNFLKTSKKLIEETKLAAIAATAGQIEKAISDLEAFKKLTKEDVFTLTDNQVKLKKELQKIELSAGMTQTQARGSIVDNMRARMNVGKA